MLILLKLVPIALPIIVIAWAIFLALIAPLLGVKWDDVFKSSRAR